MDNKKTKIGKNLILIGVTALVCLLIFIFLGYQFWLKPGVEVQPEMGGIQFEDDQFRTEATQAAESISIPGFDAWTIPRGRTKVDTHFYNPENNNCYFILTVTLDDTGETIYESKYLKPGQHLYEVELLTAMEAGTYSATLHYSTFSTDDLTPMNGAQLPFQLIVE